MLAAVLGGHAKKVAELIRQYPGFDVNLDQNGDGLTLLHYACRDSSLSAVIPLLLAHPDIDVNAKDSGGETPFFHACADEHASCVREMLKDSRVKVNEPDNDGITPLSFAAAHGSLDIIWWWIASGREIYLGEPGDILSDAISVAKMNGRDEVVTLLERFKSDAAQTRLAMRVEPGWYNRAAAEMFALVVFVSDGLLKTKATGVKAGA